MNQELIEWLRTRAHQLVRLARTLDADSAGKLETVAVEMLQHALDLEKSNRF